MNNPATTDHAQNQPLTRELGEAAAGGAEPLDEVIGWASRNLSPGDKAAFNRGLSNPGTVAKTVHDLQAIAAADAKRTGTGTGPAASAGPATAPSASNAARVVRGEFGSQVGARPPISDEPVPAGGNVAAQGASTGAGFRTGREMLRAMDEAEQRLGNWRADEQLMARIAATPRSIRTATG